MPVQGVLSLRIMAPFHLAPQLFDPVAQRFLCGVVAVEIALCGQQSLYEKRRFDQVAAVVLFAEMVRLSGACVIPVRPCAVETRQFFERPDDFRKPCDCLRTCYEPVAYARYDPHDAETGAAGGDAVRPFGVRTFVGEAGQRIGEIPEIAERVTLHHLLELFVRKVRDRG